MLHGGQHSSPMVICWDDARPSSITIFALTGDAERCLKIPLDVSQCPATFALQALFVRKTPVVAGLRPDHGGLS
jgi:hypothetical protein